MISILFHVTVKAGKEKEFHDLAGHLTDVTRAEDDGCLTYVYLRQQDNPNEYVLNEQWRDEEALDAHLAHLQALMGSPTPGERLPAAFLDLCETTRSVFYSVVA